MLGLAVIAAIVGLPLGSFLTVVAYRVPRKESVVTPRSRCPACEAGIRAVDNIPVVSYLLLRGRCRACRARISPRYPAIEVAAAGLWVAAWVGDWPAYVALILALLFTVLLAVFLIDAERGLIPNAIIYPSLLGFAVLVAIGWALGLLDGPRGAIGLLAYGGGLLLIALAYPKGMGMGDVKLAALIGLVLGSMSLSRVAVAAAGAILFGGLGGVLAMAVGKRGRKQTIPFGPFMAAAAVLAVYLGPRLADAYLRQFR